MSGRHVRSRGVPATLLAELQDLVGAPLDVEERPHVEYATIDTVRNFARSYGEENPLYSDEEYGRTTVWGGTIAPPLFPLATGTGGPVSGRTTRHDTTLAALRQLPYRIAGDHWWFHHPVKLGTRLLRSDHVAAVEADATDTARVHYCSEYSVGDTVMATHHRIRQFGTAEPDPPATALEPPPPYDDDQLAAIDHAYEEATRRGAVPRFATGVQVGERLDPLMKGPLTLTDLITYRAGVGPGPFGVEPLGLARKNRLRRPGFYDKNEFGAFDARERLHWDTTYARSQGHIAPYDYSHTRLTWASHLLTDWIGDAGWLAELRFELLGPNYVGDTHRMTGQVAAVTPPTVHLEVIGTNQRGTTTCIGTATVVLPMRTAASKGASGALQQPTDA